MTTAAKKYPDFFKVFLPKHNSERMHIPNAFMARLQGRVPKEVILINRRGSVWHVNTHCIDGQIYFDDGWKRFTEENSLEVADFIVFTYDGSNVFKFKIFELSGCEKIEVKEEEDHEEKDYAMKMEEEEEEVKEEAEEEGEKIEIKEEEEHGDKDSVMEKEVEEEEEEEQDEEDDDDDDYDYDYYDDDDEYTEMEEEKEGEYANSRNMRTQCHRRACKAPIISKRGTAGSSAAKAGDHKIKDYGIDAEKYVQPDNPYFFAKQIGNRYNELHIPSTIIKDFCLSLPQNITLCLCCKYIQRNVIRDHHLSLPEQTPIRNTLRMCKGKVHTWKDGRVCILEWGAFCRRNKIRKNDACICEFMLGEDQKIERLQVHVVRKGWTH